MRTGLRPKIYPLQRILKTMIEECWDDDKDKRPEFVKIIETLEQSSIKSR